MSYRLRVWAIVAAASVCWLSGPKCGIAEDGHASPKSSSGEATCQQGTFNTAVRWSYPKYAAVAEARRLQKPLVVMQISGNFAKESFT